MIEKLNRFFEINLNARSRLIIVVAALILIPSYFIPLWNMNMFSNQFPDGLRLMIYSYKLEGGDTPGRDDLAEINSLNHYIGMRPLDKRDFAEFNWLPFAIGIFMLLALRVAVQGKMSMLVDVVVLFGYFGLFSLWSFYYRMYTYGHNLEPTAAIKVQGFTPPLIGHKTVANFEIYSYAGVASYFLLLFGALLVIAGYVAFKNNKRRAQA
jgi:hypothetical protein